MRTHKRQTGFSAVELILVIVVIAALAFVGYTVYNRQPGQTTNTASNGTASNPAKANDVGPAPAVNSATDLDKAEATLDRTDPGASNDSDVRQLDNQLANF